MNNIQGKNRIKISTIKAKCGPDTVTVLQVADAEHNGIWWCIKGSHSVYFTEGPFLKTGRQVNNVHNDDVFTYYGNGTGRPDRVEDMYTLRWLLRDRVKGAYTSRYILYGWPASQTMMNLRGALLVKPQKDREAELDSAYLVPEESIIEHIPSKEEKERFDEDKTSCLGMYMKVSWPDVQKFSDRKYVLNVYDSEDVFVPLNPKE